ncbi:hypothetical protein [Alteraurantiacibacter aquimixticola]|uniref:Uncharacterized protein n=1 Tax=Alteraurantiacibacter aquimixticola TaxID=2489173 RepID=A0A4T3F298_9SPHN|nr:hypothetical protein [Alteraurantiacibacter aquimixticola]TIX51306.1 hypothetical protein E5222_02250 [Alteraurantiacibacter aquimixticola]
MAVLPLLIGCSGGGYDDCVLDAVGSSSSEDAIDFVEAACRRKHEVERNGSLDIQYVQREAWPDSFEVGGGDAEPQMEMAVQISNTSDYVVTQFELIDANEQSWTYNSWLEPGRWQVVDMPAGFVGSDVTEDRQFRLASARYVRVVEVK